MTDAARDVARAAENSPVMRGLARGGYAANGIVHALLGAITIAISVGGTGSPDQAGAFSALEAVPLGIAGVWALGGLLGALAIWHALQAVLDFPFQGAARLLFVASDITIVIATVGADCIIHHPGDERRHVNELVIRF